MKIGLFYGSDTGMTEEITHTIVDEWNVTDIEVIEINNANSLLSTNAPSFNRFAKTISPSLSITLIKPVKLSVSANEIEFTGVKLFSLLSIW